VRIETAPNVRQTVFVGCAAMLPGGMATAPNGRVFQEKTFAGPLPAGTIVSLAIVYGEGNDFGFPCPDPRNSCIYLHNIQVGSHVWTSASDNGNGQTIMAAPTGEDVVSALMGESLLEALTN
jgi:hypothetical protein